MATLYVLVGLAAVSALAILFMRTVLNAALCLMICILAIAGIYVVLGAELLAVVQILVYAGGILLLIIFGIMVTGRHQDVRPVRPGPTLITTIALMVMFALALNAFDASENPKSGNTVQDIGIELMTGSVAPFETGGLLILVSMIGAMIIASSKTQA